MFSCAEPLIWEARFLFPMKRPFRVRYVQDVIYPFNKSDTGDLNVEAYQ